MTNTVIVAIPEEDDPVWKISSEKVPHMTLLFLGDLSNDPNLGLVWEYIAHAASTSLHRGYVDVQSRGVLGSDEADVLFFNPKYTKDFAEFRSQMMANPVIAKSYLSVDQYPQWTPHLTLGYPATPAKKPKDGYDSKFYGVRFNKIALWTGDYAGPEFPLQDREYAVEDGGPVAMSDVETMLSHYGIKGMRWGRRKSDPGSTALTITSNPGQKVMVKGGKGLPAHEDAVRVASAKQKAKASTTDALSTKELQDLVTRMNLEQQYSRLTESKNFFQKLDNDKKNVDKLLATGKTANDVVTFINSPIGGALKGVFESTTGIKLPGGSQKSKARRAM